MNCSYRFVCYMFGPQLGVVFLEVLGTLGERTPLMDYVTGMNVFTDYTWPALCSLLLSVGCEVRSQQILGLSCCLISGKETVESDVD